MATTTDPLISVGDRIDAAPRRPLPIRSSSRGSARLRAAAKHIILILIGLLMIYPLLWMIGASLKPEVLIFSDPSPFASQIDTSSYERGWNALQNPFGVYLLNSTLLVLGALVGNLVTCSMAAYAFARLRFRGKPFLFGAMLLTLMVPAQVLLVPQYVIFHNLGWVNTFLPLIVPKFLATDAFFIFLMVQFFRSLPRELEEAARIDGAGYWRIFLQVLLPLSIPALATTAIFTFIWTWNDFFAQLIYLTKPNIQTASVALNNYVDATSGSDWGALFAMSVVTLVPVFLVFLVGQRFLIKGIATTGLK